MTTAPERTDRRTHREGDTRHTPSEWVGDRLVIRSYELARSVLRLSEGTRQAGFSADAVYASRVFRWPMLYTEGAEHREQRRQAGRHLSPKVVQGTHRPMIAREADAAVALLEQEGGGRLDLASFRFAMRVVAQVVGLTHSDPAAMERVLLTFFRMPPPQDAPRWRVKAYAAVTTASTARFWRAHVHPAVVAHRRMPRADVISSLLDQGLKERDILIECLTLAAAGMVTTRQLISVCVWHLVEDAALRERFLAAETAERHRIIYEILRLDTITSQLLRRTTAEVRVPHAGRDLVIPAGTLVEIAARPASSDVTVFGDDALSVNADRCPASRAPAQGLGFGEGHHSCPGEFLAMAETDAFLLRFFASRWRIVGEPVVEWNDVVQAYEISDLVVERR